MCKSIDDAWNGISDGATQLAGMTGLKGVGDAITTGDISKVGDETGKAWAKVDDALYDAGVRWNDVGKIAAAGALIYTGGLAAGAWGGAGTGSAAAGMGTATTTAGSTATGLAGSQGGMLAAQTAGFGAQGAALTGEALASNVAAAGVNAGIMTNYGAAAAAMGDVAGYQVANSMANGMSQSASGAGATSTATNQQSFDPTSTDGGQAKSFTDFKNDIGLGKNTIDKPNDPSWWSKQDSMTKYGIIQGAGQGISAVGSYLNQQEQQKHADQVRQEQQAIAEDNRQRMGYWVPMSPIQQQLHQNYLKNKPGLISNQMNQQQA